MQRWAARIFAFGRGIGEGAGLNNPVTELKRSRMPKKPLVSGPYRPIATGFMEMLKCLKFEFVGRRELGVLGPSTLNGRKSEWRKIKKRVVIGPRDVRRLKLSAFGFQPATTTT
jgi:hypothetical protein